MNVNGAFGFFSSLAGASSPSVAFASRVAVQSSTDHEPDHQLPDSVPSAWSRAR